MLSALVASAGNKSFVEAARRTVRFPPWERGWKGEGGRGGGKIERRKVASTRLKRWNNGEEGGGRFWVEGKTMGIQEGRVSVFSASMRRRELQGRVLIPYYGGLIAGIRRILWFLSLEFDSPRKIRKFCP